MADQGRKTVSFANHSQQGNTSQYVSQSNAHIAPDQQYQPRSTHQNFTQRPSTSNYSYNQNEQSSYNVRPSTVTTTFNQGSSQVFNNPSTIFGTGRMGMNASMVVKPEQLIKIEIYSPELNGSRNRHYSARLASFIKSLNTVKARQAQYGQQYDASANDDNFVNGGVWAKQFSNRNAITVVINGTHIVENFPLTIFNEDPNWNFKNEMKTYRGLFVKTIHQFPGCKMVEI